MSYTVKGGGYKPIFYNNYKWSITFKNCESLYFTSVTYSNYNKQIKSEVRVAQSCPTLCNHMDYTVHGIL